MARLLIYASRDHDIGKGSLLIGEVIAVKPASHRWGRKERKPLFVRLDITDMPTETQEQQRVAWRKLRPLVQPVYVFDAAVGKYFQLTNRRFRLKPSMIQAAIINQDAQDTWRITATEAQVRSAVERYTNECVKEGDATAKELDDAAAALDAGSVEI